MSSVSQYSSSNCEPVNLCIDPCFAQRKVIYCDPDQKCDYNNKVYHKYCKTKDDCSYQAPDIFYPKQDAVVGVVTQATIVAGGTGTTLITKEGSGFLIIRKDECKDRQSFYVVTTASLAMLAPEQIRVPPPPAGFTGFQRMESYYIEIQNVNGKCKNYVYQGLLRGIDGAGNIAVIELDMNMPYNKGNPCIKKKCHPYLDFEYVKPNGCDEYVSASRHYATGDAAFVLGKAGNDNNTSITEGVISNNRYAPGDDYYFEAVTTDSDSTLGDIGAPLINKRGKVIGVIAGVLNAGVTGIVPSFLGGGATRTLAISEFSALPVVEAFTGGIRCDCNSHLQIVPDAFGQFYRYIKGYLGMEWHYTNATDLIVAGNTLFKRIEGIVIEGVTSASPFFTQFGGITGVGVSGITGAIITHINTSPIGQINPQVSPAAILSRLTPDLQICICYRILGDNYSTSANASAYAADYPTNQDNPF